MVEMLQLVNLGGLNVPQLVPQSLLQLQWDELLYVSLYILEGSNVNLVLFPKAYIHAKIICA